MAQVDPSKVKDFLNNTPPPGAVESPAEIVVDYEKAVEMAKEAEKELQEGHDRVEEERSKVFDSENGGLAHLNAWIHETPNIKVEVSETDKALYFKSLLNDEPLQLTITLPILDGLPLTFKALTNYDLEIVFLSLRQLTEEGKIVGTSQYASRVQQCAVALQLVKYNNARVDTVILDPSKSANENAKQLQDHVDRELVNWPWPKWQAVVTALREFETKLSICNDNARNGNFWKPVDSN